MEELTSRKGPRSVLNVNLREMVGMTAQIPDDTRLAQVRPVVGKFLEEAKEGASEKRVQEILDELVNNPATSGVASALSAAVKDSQALAFVLQSVLDFWDQKKNPANEAATVKSSSSLKRNYSDDEQAIWDLINRS
jgi:hypothetical protein